MYFFSLNSYAWIAYAVIVEKYTHNTALQDDTIILLSIPDHIGNVPFTKFFQFVSKCELGISVNPFCNSPLDLVALMNNT